MFVKALHAGNEGNELADDLANQGVDQITMNQDGGE